MLRRRRLKASAVAVLAAWALVGCTSGGGVSTPTPTPAALTEEEAYAAAEDAFRAYIDAINQIVISDASTFTSAFSLSTGQLNSGDRKKYSEWHANKWVENGNVLIQSIAPSSVSEALDQVTIAVCLDASDVTLTNANGESQVSPDRPAIAPIDANILLNSGGWRVEQIRLADGRQC